MNTTADLQHQKEKVQTGERQKANLKAVSQTTGFEDQLAAGVPATAAGVTAEAAGHARTRRW